jgi:RimJ/RimL family protein N-acetyltransferase
LGAHRDGVLRQHKRRHDDTIRDSVEYSIIADEWPALRAKLAATLER